MKKKKPKQKEDHAFTHCFQEISFGVIIEILVSIVWNVLAFIPRVLIRLWSSF